MKKLTGLIFFVFGLIYTFQLNAQGLPIVPERVISFNTTSGSYMSIAVSPDGRTLAFDLLGDIYTMPAEGGNAKQLTRGLALHLRPVWSPDGSSLAYECDSTGMMLTHLREVATGKVTIMNKLERTPFAGQSKPIPANSDIPQYGEKIFSPDGRWVAYIDAQFKVRRGRRVLFLYDLTTNTKSVLIPGLMQQDTSASFEQRFCFAPDSKSIYISYGGKIHQVEVESRKDKIIPFTADVKVDCGPIDYHTFRISQKSFLTKYIRSASLSPDRKHLVFSALNRIYVLDLPNGKPRLLVKQDINQYQPVFSPDGKWVAYVSWSDSNGGALWKVTTVGGQPQQLSTRSGQYQRPAWSPDGSKIAVIRGRPILGDRDDAGKGELLLIDRNSRHADSIADNLPLWNVLSFAADGKSISYVPGGRAGRKSEPQLVKQNLNDKVIQPIIQGITKGSSQHQFQYQVSPDGQYMVYPVGEDLHLVSMGQAKSLVISDSIPVLRFAQGVDPYWDSDGKVLNWTYANRFYSVSLKKLVAALPDSGFAIHTINPDKEVALNISMPVLTGKGVLALTNARLITMKGDQVITSGCIIVRDGRIAAIGDMGKVVIPKGAKVLDMQGKSIMPGLVDLHCHMRVPSEVWPRQSVLFMANLAYGVTTARDPSLSFDSFGYTDLIKNGQMVGPRLFSVGRSVNLVFGLKLDSLQDARSIVAKRKLFEGIAIKQYNLPSRTQKQWLVQAAREVGLNMTNEGDRNPFYQIAMVKDGSSGIEHSPMWRDVYDDVISFFAKSGTCLTPTLQVDYGSEGAKEYLKYNYWRNPDAKLERFTLSNPGQDRPYPTSNGAETIETIKLTEKPNDDANPGFLHAAKVITSIYRAGGKIGMGSHGNNEGIGAHNEIWALQMGGLNNIDALRIATIHGAEALGVQQDLGSLEPGKIADLLILNKNPLDDIHNTREIRYIMKDGVLYDGDTLNMIWPFQRKCPDWRPGQALLAEQNNTKE